MAKKQKMTTRERLAKSAETKIRNRKVKLARLQEEFEAQRDVIQAEIEEQQEVLDLLKRS